MGNHTEFKEYERKGLPKRPVEDRIRDYKEISILLPDEDTRRQAARCMDCGTPFCSWACPLNNLSPDINQLVYKGRWQKAYNVLSQTNRFPEFTGRVCPALCEGSCTLGVNREPVATRDIELSVIERAFDEGWVKPEPPRLRTDMKVAVVGSGPAGLSAAAHLNSLGHYVTVFEKCDSIGGLLRYGIPDFKLEKQILDRRINILEQEGIQFTVNTNVGVNYDPNRLEDFDAVLLAAGSGVPRDLNVDGRGLEGVYLALEYLAQQNRRVSGRPIQGSEISAKGKNVIVIGGGDTGADCVGTAIRQGAKSVIQYEILGKPPLSRDSTMPWPDFPRTLKVSASHEEGCTREWCVSTTKILGNGSSVSGIQGIRVNWEKDEYGGMVMKEVPGTEFAQQADLIIIAMGFLHPDHGGIVQDLGLELDGRGNIKTGCNYTTSTNGVFAAGDARTGQSLVVRCIKEGMEAARHIDDYLACKLRSSF